MLKNVVISNRLESLRVWMRANGYSAVIIPQKDPHHSEYVEDYYKLRTWFCGFDGSAGILAVSLTEAGLWTDSRYYIQADIQLNGTGVTLYKDGLPDTESMYSWLSGVVRDGGAVACNAKLFSIEEWSEMLEYVDLCDDDGYESLWQDRPPLSNAPVYIVNEEIAGESAFSKISRVRREMSSETEVISNLDDIAWLLNIRGGDVEYNPVVRSFLILGHDYIKLFIDSNKISNEIADYFETLRVEICQYNEFFEYRKQTSNKSIISRFRAVKNLAEQLGYRKSMVRDGVVWVKFLRWFEDKMSNDTRLLETDIAHKLYELKSQQPNFIDESFATIAGYGSNGAIVHYRAEENNCSIIENKGLLLIDTGTHYKDGTTDMTRTLACGRLSDEEMEDYTMVLKGHIALAMAVFPVGTPCIQIDSIARMPLWKCGKNYGHGTGHGVGFAQSVHEGCFALNQRCIKPLEPNITMTNEPGYYKDGSHGIRLENVELIVEMEKRKDGRFLRMEPLTIAPFDLTPIKKEMLTSDEIMWLNNYHREVIDRLSPYLNNEEIIWLKRYAKAI